MERQFPLMLLDALCLPKRQPSNPGLKIHGLGFSPDRCLGWSEVASFRIYKDRSSAVLCTAFFLVRFLLSPVYLSSPSMF